MAIRPVYRPTIVKKRTKKFIRHQSDRYSKLKVYYIVHYLLYYSLLLNLTFKKFFNFEDINLMYI